MRGVTSDELKRWRAKHGVGQQELADKLGVHLQTVSKWERDVQAIPPFLPLALETIERNLLVKDRKPGRPSKKPTQKLAAKKKLK